MVEDKMSNLKIEDMIIYIFAIHRQFIRCKKDSMEELVDVAANKHIFIILLTLSN